VLAYTTLCSSDLDAADLAFLQYPQQPGLGLQGQLADLVEEQGTAVGGFHQAGTARDRAGKGALFVPEQLGFDEGFRNRRTVYRDHRRMGPGGVLVQGAGNQLLAGAGFTADQYRGHGRRDLADALEQRLHGRAGADDAHILRPLCRGGSLAWRPFRLAAGFYAAGHRLQHLVMVEGLGNVIHRAQLHGIHRRAQAGITGHDQHRSAGCQADQLGTGLARQTQVTDDQIEVTQVVALYGLMYGTRFADLVVVALQQPP